MSPIYTRQCAYDEQAQAEAVVIGAGLAGLSVALELAKATDVTLISKTRLGEGGSSSWAQGGIAAAVGRDDSAAQHAADTLVVGDGLSDPATVRVLTGQAAERIRFLLAHGARLDRDHQHELALGREAGHSRHRIVHAHGDQTGAELVRALTQAVREHPRIQVVDQTFALELLVEGGRVIGVLTRAAADGQRTAWAARAVVLATGGVGRVYARTTNPPEVTGDGLAMAWRAGARLADLEFMQFHPTALLAQRDPLPLLTEALRGEGALLVDAAGRRFLQHEHPAAELAPRDVVSRAIWRVEQAGGQVFLDARGLGETLVQRFPTVFGLCQLEGLDPRRDLLPVAPAAHYHIGGVAVDAIGRTSLGGLWSVGEDACTGVHGANRLASNSLLEAVVFAAEVARDVLAQRATAWSRLPRPVQLGTARFTRLAPGGLTSTDDLAWAQRIRELMWTHVGLVREAQGLQHALSEFEQLAMDIGPVAGELQNMLEVARLITLSALSRRESRGVHYRLDYPQHESGEPYHVTLTREAVEHQLARVA